MAKQELKGGRNWYAIHTYAGYENAVMRNLKQRIDSLGMNDKIFNIFFSLEYPEQKSIFLLEKELIFKYY